MEALPYKYTITWARNRPALTSIEGKAHRFDCEKLLLTTNRPEEEMFLEPEEWFRETVQSFSWVGYLQWGRDEYRERMKEFMSATFDSPSYVYHVESRHVGQPVSVFADSHKHEGNRLRLLLKELVVADFDDPVTWRRHGLPETEGYSDDEL